MNKILALLALFALALPALAQQWSSGSLSAGVTRISATPIEFNYIQLTDSSGAVNTITLYDNSSNSSTNVVIPAVSNVRLTYTTNIVTSFTNRAGVVQTATNAVLFTTTQTIAGTTNEARRLYRITLPANGSAVFEPDGLGLGTSFGLNVLSTGAGSYNLRSAPLP